LNDASIPSHLIQIPGAEPLNDVLGYSVNSNPNRWGFISALVKAFWPSSSQDIWKEMANDVEMLVNKLLTQQQLSKYSQMVMNQTPYPQLLQFVLILDTIFSGKVCLFGTISNVMCPGSVHSSLNVPAIGIFAQFSNLHLAVLRDQYWIVSHRTTRNNYIISNVCE
jgi:hypothetical protein